MSLKYNDTHKTVGHAAHMLLIKTLKLTVSSNLCIWAMERPKAMLKGVKIEPGVVWQVCDKNTKIKE